MPLPAESSGICQVGKVRLGNLACCNELHQVILPRPESFIRQPPGTVHIGVVIVGTDKVGLVDAPSPNRCAVAIMQERTPSDSTAASLGQGCVKGGRKKGDGVTGFSGGSCINSGSTGGHSHARQ
jgi:hypothetical protein